MFWFRRPHYVRWIAGATLVLIAFAMDMTKGARAPYPFAAVDLDRGHILSDEDVDWRDVPVGLLPEHDLSAGQLTRPLSAGEPIVAFSIGARAAIPSDWWAVPLDLPESVAAGASVRIVLLNPVLAVDGIVVEPGGMGTFGVTEAALVAVPGEAAVSVATAAARNELTILISPAGDAE